MVMLCFFYDAKGPREITSLVQSGKGIVIVITIVFSCLSFTLGFFVGKSGTNNRTEVSAVATAPALSQQLQNSLPAEAPKAQPELSGAPTPSTQTQAGNGVSPIKPSAPPQEIPGPKSGTKSGTAPGHEPARAERDAVATKVKEVSKTAVQENRQDSRATLYAVQLGAFRHRAEAEKVKAKYSKKGYKIYIEAIKEDRNMKIYKLRTGEFREKKDAEVLALKLKKSENLKTFVVTLSK